MKKFNQKNKVFLFLIIILFGIFFGSMINYFYLTEDIIYLDLLTTIDNTGEIDVGFNLDSDKINFGILSSESTAYRRYDFVNIYNKSVVYIFSPQGEIASGIQFQLNGVYYENSVAIKLKEGETEELTLYFDPSRDSIFQESRDYPGQLKILVKKDVFSFF